MCDIKKLSYVRHTTQRNLEEIISLKSLQLYSFNLQNSYVKQKLSMTHIRAFLPLSDRDMIQQSMSFDQFCCSVHPHQTFWEFQGKESRK